MFHFSFSPLLSFNRQEPLYSLLKDRCVECQRPIDEEAGYCDFCEAVERAARSRSLISRIKSRFGMELATGLVILSLEEPERFFTNGEIDSLLDPEKMVPLKTNDVPHWEIMFFTKKRINKPNR